MRIADIEDAALAANQLAIRFQVERTPNIERWRTTLHTVELGGTLSAALDGFYIRQGEAPIFPPHWHAYLVGKWESTGDPDHSLYREPIEISARRRALSRCPDCKGTRLYIGLNETRPCPTCCPQPELFRAE